MNANAPGGGSDNAETLPFSISDVIVAVRRRAAWIVFLALAGCALGAAWASRQSNVYRSTATLFVNSSNNPQEFSLNVANLAATRDILLEALKDAHDPARSFELSSQRLLPAGFEVVLDTKFIRLSAADISATHAAELANAWAHAVIEGKRHQYDSGANAGTDARDKEIASRLAKAQQELSELGFQEPADDGPAEKRPRKPSSTLRVSIDAVLQRMTEQRMTLQQLRGEEQFLTALDAARVTDLPRARENETLRALHDEIASARAQLANERSAGTPNSAKIKMIETSLAGLERKAASFKPGLLAAVRAEASLAEAQLEKLDILLKQLREKMYVGYCRLVGIEQELAELDNLRAQLRARSAERADAAEAVLAVFDPAVPALAPYKRVYVPAIIAALGGCGALAGAALVLGLEIFSRRLRGARQLDRQLGLKPLAIIPRARSINFSAAAQTEDSPVSEALKKLAAEVIAIPARPQRSGALVVAVLSAVGKEGRSVVAASLAALGSSTGKRVLLVDAARGSSTLSAQWNLSGGPTFASLLKAPRWQPDATVAKDGFKMLPAGIDAAVPLATVDAMNALLNAVRPHFDLVVIDTGPLLSASVAVSAGAAADVAILLMRNRHVSTLEIEHALEILRRVPELRILPVLNDVDKRDMKTDGFAT